MWRLMQNALLLCSLFIVIIPDSVMACGGFFFELQEQPVVQSGEAIVFGVQGSEVTMHVQILYEGPAEGFSWVLPMPVKPDEIAVGSDRLFSAMFAETLPTFQLDIQDVQPTDTCSEVALEPWECNFIAMGGPMYGGGEAMPNAIVLEKGSVGPFDFVILEAAENDPSSVFRWLETNGYDQPEEAAALLNYYATNNHVFVALRLQKDAESGEIQPLILKYQMPTTATSTTSPARVLNQMPFACVPIQLTRIAAVQAMPIQVYILGDARAVPLNFMELELDYTQVDWLGCVSRGSQCYDDSYRGIFDRAANDLLNHTFVTEYAGNASVMSGSIAINVTKEEIASVNDEQEFFALYRPSLPDVPLVNNILNEYFSTEDRDGNWTFNATQLAEELHERVLLPARNDQAFVDQFSYLTRLYARLGPNEMTKDPFFTFKPELPTVSNLHRATARPACSNDIPISLDITLDDDDGTFFSVPAQRDDCGGWVSRDDVLSVNDYVVPARKLSSFGFAGNDPIIVLRSDDGSFDRQAVEQAVQFGDSLVMSQEIPAFNGITSNGTTTAESPGRESSGETQPVIPNATTDTVTLVNATTTTTLTSDSYVETPSPSSGNVVPAPPAMAEAPDEAITPSSPSSSSANTTISPTTAFVETPSPSPENPVQTPDATSDAANTATSLSPKRTVLTTVFVSILLALWGSSHV